MRVEFPRILKNSDKMYNSLSFGSVCQRPSLSFVKRTHSFTAFHKQTTNRIEDRKDHNAHISENRQVHVGNTNRPQRQAEELDS